MYVVMGAAAALVLAAAGAEALRYRGERIDIYTGDVLGRWIIRTREVGGPDLLRTRVRCRPRNRCGAFRRLNFDLTREAGTEFSYTGEFLVDGATCQIDATVYSLGFEGVYTCGATQGSISGRTGRN
jgi:hypothetical protein